MVVATVTLTMVPSFQNKHDIDGFAETIQVQIRQKNIKDS